MMQRYSITTTSEMLKSWADSEITEVCYNEYNPMPEDI